MFFAETDKKLKLPLLRWMSGVSAFSESNLADMTNSMWWKTIKKPTIRTMGKSKCFHNGIILIVISWNLLLQMYKYLLYVRESIVKFFMVLPYLVWINYAHIQTTIKE